MEKHVARAFHKPTKPWKLSKDYPVELPSGKAGPSPKPVAVSQTPPRELSDEQRARAMELQKKKELQAKMDIVVQSLTYSAWLNRNEIISLLRGKKVLDGLKEAELEGILTKLVEARKAVVQPHSNQLKWKRS